MGGKKQETLIQIKLCRMGKRDNSDELCSLANGKQVGVQTTAKKMLKIK